MPGVDQPAVDCAARVAALEETNRALVTQLRIAEAFAESGPGLAATVTLCHILSGRPVALLDERGRIVTSAPKPRQSAWAASVVHEVSKVAAGDPSAFARPRLIAANPHTPIRRRILACAVAGAPEPRWLTIEETGTGIGAADVLVARLGAARLGAEFQAQHRIARVVHDARSALARQLIRGTGCLSDLRASAGYLGVDLDAARLVVHILDRDQHEAVTGAMADTEDADADLVARIARDLNSDVLHSRGSEGMVLLIEIPGELTEFSRRVREVLRLTLPDRAVAGISRATEPAALARAYREAREVAHCVSRFGADSAGAVLTVDDLGPARLFLANSELTALRRYVTDVLGPLLAGGEAHTDLLVTLQEWLDAGRSVRLCAARLGLHENTIRLRLARIQTITGLDVGNANDQLGLQTALLVVRLQGHPALPDFDAREAPPADRCTA